MNINLFEGGRRIALLLMVMWAAGCALIAFSLGWPRVESRFEIRSPAQPPNRVTTLSCDSDSRTKWDYGRTTPNGTKYNVEMCFAATDFPGGRLIPYKLDLDGTLWGNTPYSTEIDSYTEAMFQNWQPRKQDLAWIDSQKWSVRYKRLSETALWVFGGVLTIWLLSTTLGWIVRGFMGISAKMDRRSD